MMTKMLTNLCVGVTFGNCVMKQNMRRREDIKVIMYLPTSITVTRSINRTNMFTTVWYFGYLLVECGLSSEWIYSNLFMSIFKPLYCNKGDVCVEVLQC